MPTPEAPTIDAFMPVDSYQAVGVGYVVMQGPEGVRLDVSETGAARIDEDPAIAALLTRMGAFIGEHGMYKATIDVKDREPGSILRVGESKRESHQYGYNRVVLASVYHPDAAPGVIVKAYDYDRMSANLQFYLGGWLHGALARADDGVNSPAQLAFFRAAPGVLSHRTAVMDFAPGEDLYGLAREMSIGARSPQDHIEIDRLAADASQELRERIVRMTGWRGALVANDLRNQRNIIDPEPETATPDTLLGRPYTVIDQPITRKRNIALQAMARYMPAAATKSSAQPKPIESPATSV